MHIGLLSESLGDVTLLISKFDGVIRLAREFRRGCGEHSS